MQLVSYICLSIIVAVFIAASIIAFVNNRLQRHAGTPDNGFCDTLAKLDLRSEDIASWADSIANQTETESRR